MPGSGRSRRCCSHGRRRIRHHRRLDLLKAGSAQNRTPLRGTKWNCGLHSARRTLGPGFRPDPRTPVRAFGLALLAALGIVLEILVVKEELLARGKDEFGA